MKFIILENDKVAGVFSMPASEVESFKNNNPHINIVAYTGNTNNIIGMNYTSTTGQLSGTPLSAVPVLLPVSRTEFKQLFTPQERAAIKQAKNTDSLLQEYYEVLDDPSVTSIDLNLQSTKDLVTLLVTKNLLTQERANEVLSRTFK